MQVIGQWKSRFILSRLGLAALLLLSPGCFSQSTPSENIAKAQDFEPAKCLTTEEANLLADQAFQLINLERAAEGISPVASDSKLTNVASDFACRMVELGFFGHRDPITDDGPANRSVAGKYRFYMVGENLAEGQETAADVVRLWMESESHREIILGQQWKEAGVAVRNGSDGSIYWVAEFGDPLDF